LKVDESFSHSFFSWSTNNSSKNIGVINTCIILIFFLHCLLIYMFIDLIILKSSFYYWYARSTMEIKSIATIVLMSLLYIDGVIIGWGFQLSIELVCNWQNKKSMKPTCNMINAPIGFMIALSKRLFLVFMQWGGDVLQDIFLKYEMEWIDQLYKVRWTKLYTCLIEFATFYVWFLLSFQSRESMSLIQD